MTAETHDRPSLTDEEEQVVKSLFLGLKLIVRALARREPRMAIKRIIDGVTDQFRDLVGVEFWKKAGSWLKAEIERNVKEFMREAERPGGPSHEE